MRIVGEVEHDDSGFGRDRHLERWRGKPCSVHLEYGEPAVGGGVEEGQNGIRLRFASDTAKRAAVAVDEVEADDLAFTVARQPLGKPRPGVIDAGSDIGHHDAARIGTG